MNNILSLLKIISEYKKEIEKIDPSCKVVFNLSNEYNGNYNSEHNIISISLARLGTNPFSLDLSEEKLASVVFSCFHERRHLIDFKFRDKEDVSEMIFLEKMAFENKRWLYKNRLYGDIWYEQRAICDGYISGMDFLKNIFPTSNLDNIFKNHIDKLSEIKYPYSNMVKYPFLSEIKNMNATETKQFIKSVFNTIPETQFPSFKNRVGNVSVYNVYDFKCPKRMLFFTDDEISNKQYKVFATIEKLDFHNEFYNSFDSLSRKEQLLKMINLDSSVFPFVREFTPDFTNPEDRIKERYDYILLSEETIKKLNLEPNKDPRLGDFY